MALTFSIGEVPRTKPFQFADLAELIILTGQTSQVSKADLSELILTGRLDSDSEGSEEALTDQMAITASQDRNIEDCFTQLHYRAGAFGEQYPFVVENSLLQPRQGAEAITTQGYAYLFSLVCSRLASFTGMTGFRQNCAQIFTRLCCESLKNLLKHSADVYVFDAGSNDRAKKFHSNLRVALRMLAKKLNARPDEYVIKQQSTSGDGGLDLVAFNGLGDTANGVFAYFGQCAAQQDGWPKKTLETLKSKAFFIMRHPANNLLFTPVLFRTASGEWVNDASVELCIVMDRLRIIRSLKNFGSTNPSVFKNIKGVVDAVAKAKSD